MLIKRSSYIFIFGKIQFCMRTTIKNYLLSCLVIILSSANVFAQVGANNVCSGAFNIVPVTGACPATTYSLQNATVTTGLGAGNYDAWYKFTTPANIRNVVVSIPSSGSNLSAANFFIEAFPSNTCPTDLAGSLGVAPEGAAGLSLTNLSPNTEYLFRVYSTTNPTAGSAASWNYTVCVSYTAVPANDDCSATSPVLTIGTTLAGTVQNATASTATVGCATGTADDDVWYRFTTSATQTYASISLTPGTLFKANGAMLQLYSGACGSLISVACGQEEITITGGLSPSTQYYVRVYSSVAYSTTPVAGTGNNFSILVSSPARTNITAGKMNEVYRQTIISPANALADPWEITYGPDNYLWITEAKGYKVNRMNPVTGAKQIVLDVSQGSTFLPVADQPFNAQFNIATNNPQGGFAGLALHPNFTGAAGGQNYVYVSYVHTWISGVAYTNRIVRFQYNPATNKLESPVSLCDTIPGSGDHNSQRMIIAPMTQGGSDYYLFYAAGDMGAGQQFPTAANITRPQKAQVLNAYEGKILRFALSDTCSGTGNQKWIPSTNPYNDVAPIVGKSAVWCTGMRNNQGFAYNPDLNILYGSSHGAFSDDEINIIEGFKNYGHPLIIGYAADGNYNGTTTPGLSTSTSAGVAFGWTGGIYTVDGQAAAAGTCPPIGNETTNMNNINATAALYGAYKDPLFSAYPGTGAGSVSSIWSAASTPGNAGWHSEGWSGLGLYTTTYIPGWKNALLAAGLKWGRTIRLKLNASGTAVVPTAGADTATYFQSTNRYRDIAFSPNGRDIYLSMDRSAAASAATVGSPPATVGACLGCVVRYEFLGYAADATALAGSTISKSIDVTNGTLNTCNTGTPVTINAENGNTNLWVPITGPDGNIMAEINANGNNLGIVTSSFYKKSGGIRSAGATKYLDRNITITPQFQPTLPAGSPLVKIRLYLSKAEFDALDADLLSGVSSINDLKILKNNDPCSPAVMAATTMFAPTNTLLADLQHGANGYVLQADVPSFSSFYFASSNITVLPLGLLTFTGTLQTNNSVLLNWKTENERNTSHFIVERSIDGSNFNSIGRVAATGNSIINNYALTDNDAANQQALLLYYRLKMVDADGRFSYSSVITIRFSNITTTSVSVFPNPAKNEATLSVTTGDEMKIQWQLIDNTGRVLINKNAMLRNGVNNITVDLSNYTTGTYFIKLSGENINEIRKIQKQ
jgi:trimeric autotransporter adhesin